MTKKKSGHQVMRKEIINLLLNKAALKQDVADYSENALDSFKRVIQAELDLLRKSVDDKRVRLRFQDKGKFEFRVYVGSDALVFQLHTNIFRPADDDPIWKTKYLKKNGANGYFAVIRIYNFLAESVEQNRVNDLGYLIGRIFMNHEHHFILEGIGELDGLYTNLEKNSLTDDVILEIVHHCVTLAIEFDLITPPYDVVQEVSLHQINNIGTDLLMATGKRMGFKFSAEENNEF